VRRVRALTLAALDADDAPILADDAHDLRPISERCARADRRLLKEPIEVQPAQAMAGPVARERNVERRSEEIQPQDLARRRHAPHLRADPELVEPGDAQG